MNKKVVRLKESDLENIVRRVLKESEMAEKSSCYETMEGTCGSMYEAALSEGKDCMEAYKSMCGEMNTLMEEYKTKCQESALSEGYLKEEDINEQEEFGGGDEIEVTLDQVAMLLKDGECSCGGETLVLDLEGGHEDEEDEDEDED